MLLLLAIDFLIFLTIWAVAQVIFRGYEQHVPRRKRMIKLIVLVIIVFSIHQFAGRFWYYSTLGAMGVAIAILHGYWFHFRNGIHWRTAEPREKYLKLVGRAK